MATKADTRDEVRRSDFARLIRRLLLYVSDQRRMIAFALLSMVAHAAARSYPVLVTKKLIDDVFLAGDGAPGILLWLSLSFLLAAAVGAATYFFNEYFFKWLAAHVMIRMRADIMTHLLRLPLRFFHKERMGHLMSRLTNDVQITFRSINTFVSEVVLLPIMIATSVAVAFWVSWRLSLFILVLLPLVGYPVIRFGRKIVRRSKRGLESLADTTDVMLQTISGIRTVKAFRAEAAEEARFAQANRLYLHRTLKVVRAKAQGRAIMDFIYHGATAAFLFGGGWLVLEGRWDLKLGELTAFLVAMGTLFRPVKRLAAAYNELQESLAGSARIFEVLDTPVAEETTLRGEPIDAIREEIRLERVSFAYEAETGTVLEDIDFTIRRGETVALVGRSGSGKSTVADLIAGFYRPDAGRITIDGRDLWEIERKSYLDRLALVSQTPFVFNTTVRENILYGRPGATEDEVHAAARAAHVHDVFAALPDGYDTIVGERGVTLSGGELQRLTIARAILKNADLLILDEATSSLDSESERLVQAALDRLSAGRTTLVIAHRLSTVRKADRIVVLESGRLKETGTHDELMARPGVYAELCALQGL